MMQDTKTPHPRLYDVAEIEGAQVGGGRGLAGATADLLCEGGRGLR